MRFTSKASTILGRIFYFTNFSKTVEVSEVATFVVKMAFTISQLILLSTVSERTGHGETIIKLLVISIITKLSQLPKFFRLYFLVFFVVIWVTAIEAELGRRVFELWNFNAL